MSGGGTYDFAPNNATASSFAALSVYGSITSGGAYKINGSGGVAVASSSNATFDLNTAGPVYIGGNNTGAISGATGSITIVGANSGSLTTSGGNVYVGGNSGTITVNGNAATIGDERQQRGHAADQRQRIDAVTEGQQQREHHPEQWDDQLHRQPWQRESQQRYVDPCRQPEP